MMVASPGFMLSVGIGISTTLGAAVGAVGSALVSARSHKPIGASALVEAASELTDRLLRRNGDLAQENREVRQALLRLSDAVSHTEHEMPHPSDATIDELRAANRAAQGLL